MSNFINSLEKQVKRPLVTCCVKLEQGQVSFLDSAASDIGASRSQVVRLIVDAAIRSKSEFGK